MAAKKTGEDKKALGAAEESTPKAKAPKKRSIISIKPKKPAEKKPREEASAPTEAAPEE